MPFTVQNNSGNVAGANAYITSAFFKTYHKDRGTDISAFGTGDIEKAIIRATDHVDSGVGFRYGGQRTGLDQTTQFPRINLEDESEFTRVGILSEVEEATAEYAFLALTIDLLPVPDRDSTGQIVQSKSEKVGPISESQVYTVGGSFILPKYPKADQKLRATGLVVSGRIVRRA